MLKYNFLRGDPMKKYIVTLITYAFFTCSATIAAIRTDLTFGTMTMSGSVMSSYDIAYNARLSKNAHKFSIGSNIGMGYFVADNVLIEVGLPIQFSMHDKSTFVTTGISLGTNYYFDIDAALFPYLGLSVSPFYFFHAKKFGLSTQPAVGVLLSISESVALDFALRSDIGIALSANDHWSFRNALGYAGIKAFF